MDRINVNDIATSKFVADNQNMFEKVAKEHERNKIKNNGDYTVLNYKQILTEMIKYVDGYKSYKKKGDDKYKSKVLDTTISFYNNMFTDTKYRKRIMLNEFPELNKDFLVLTKELQSKLVQEIDEAKIDNELNQILLLTNNQYKKLSKVCKDDMDIFLWLLSIETPAVKHDIPVSLKVAYNDKTTPVIHSVK